MPPRLSVIVPVHNDRVSLGQCICALLASHCEGMEIIVVDDGSTDNTLEAIRMPGVRVLRKNVRSGPAAARNCGARYACGQVLVFVDADVVVHPETLSRIAWDLEKFTKYAAVFGSYDDNPSHSGFVSQYKNLYHHFVHQTSSQDAATFWAGIGAIRKSVFEEIGAFDECRYRVPSIEDVELGYRLIRTGHRVMFDPLVQGKHLKRWTMGQLFYVDCVRRAVPWSRLLLEEPSVPRTLNVSRKEQICVAFTAAAALLAPLALEHPWSLIVAAALIGWVLGANARLYSFLWRRKGLLFAARALPLHVMYYLYCGAAYALCWTMHNVRSRREQKLRQPVRPKVRKTAA